MPLREPAHTGALEGTGAHGCPACRWTHQLCPQLPAAESACAVQLDQIFTRWQSRIEIPAEPRQLPCAPLRAFTAFCQPGIWECWRFFLTDFSAGQSRVYLQDAAGRRSLVFDLSMTHDRFGSSSHVQQKGLLSHPQDLDAPLRLAAHRKINSCRQQYADNPSGKGAAC